MPHDALSKRGFGGIGDCRGMGRRIHTVERLADFPITGHARPATGGTFESRPDIRTDLVLQNSPDRGSVRAVRSRWERGPGIRERPVRVTGPGV